MNSFYGYLGAKFAHLVDIRIASAVTKQGRGLIMLCKRTAERRGHTVAYGDSVTADTPLLVRDDRTRLVRVMRIDAIASAWRTRADGKEVAPVADTSVWADGGFTPLQQVVRHAYTGTMYRVSTFNGGVVDCTAHHSLLRPNGAEVAPAAVGVGDALLHTPPPSMHQHRPFARMREAALMGMFMALGKTDGVVAWSLASQDEATLERAMVLVHMGGYTACIEHGKLRATRTSAPALARRYRALFYDDHGHKCPPAALLAAPCHTANMFWASCFSARRRDTLWVTSKHAAATMMLLARKLQRHVTCRLKGDKLRLKLVPRQDFTQRKAGDCIKALSSRHAVDEVVYDVTTTSSHFAVLPGYRPLVVHNTDSIFVVQGPQEGEKEARALASAINGELGRMHAAGVNLEYEKIYRPLLLKKRKQYAGLLSGKLSVSGLTCKRTDGFALQRRAQADVLEKLLAYEDAAAHDAYRAALRHVQLSVLAPADFARSAALTKPLEAYARPLPVHAAVAERAGGLSKGDRVPYVVLNGAGTVADRAVLPEAAAGAELDRAYYAALLQQSIAGLLSLVIDAREVRATSDAARRSSVATATPGSLLRAFGYAPGTTVRTRVGEQPPRKRARLSATVQSVLR